MIKYLGVNEEKGVMIFSCIGSNGSLSTEVFVEVNGCDGIELLGMIRDALFDYCKVTGKRLDNPECK